jgi:hypothetical protein
MTDKILEQAAAELKETVLSSDLVTTEEKVLTIDDKARAMGWRPLEEYKGDPDAWVDAKEFVSRSSFFKKIDSLKEKIQTQEQVIRTMNQTLSLSERRGYEKALEEAKQQMAEARAQGNFKEYEKAVMKQADIVKNIPASITHTEDFTKEQYWKEFVEQNPWQHQSDLNSQIKRAAALVMTQNLQQSNPNISNKEITDYIHKEIRVKFPDEFKHEQTYPTVMSSGRQNSSTVVSNSLEGLNEAQKQAIKYLESKNLDTKEILSQFRKGKK